MAKIEFNPITGKFDLVGSGGGGVSYIDGEVEFHGDLPVNLGVPAINSAFLVRKGSGLYFISRKPAGIWVRELNNGNLDDWKYAGTFSDLYRDANFRIINDADTSKEIAFSAASIASGQTRVLTVPDKNITIADNADIPAPSAATPSALGTAAAGTSADFARGDHVHPLPQLTETKIYTANGTWTKPAGAKLVHYIIISGGCGGGGGRRSDSSTAASGGQGGNGGGVIIGWNDASYFGSTETVTVGAGGAGGGARTADNTNGANGTAGGNSSFGATLVATPLTGAGSGGTTAAVGFGTSITNALLYYATLAPLSRGGATSITGNSNAGIQANINPSAGGGGGSKSSSNVYYVGGNGGLLGEGQNRVGQTAGGQAAANAAGGNGGPSHLAFFGTGGAGGSPDSSTGAANKGGNGGLYGAGGGGGSGSINGAGGDNSGGDGAQGIVVVTTYF